MTTTQATAFQANGLQFQGAGTYRIRILGTLAHHWFDWVDHMDCTVNESQDGKAITTLRGEFRDQAALLGLLNTVYDLHLSLLQVEYLGRKHDRQQEPDMPEAPNAEA